MGATDPYVTITEPTFVARILLDPDTDTEDSVANVDAFVDESRAVVAFRAEAEACAAALDGLTPPAWE